MAELPLSGDEYLNRSTDASHMLGRLVRHPEPENGVVHTPCEIITVQGVRLYNVSRHAF